MSSLSALAGFVDGRGTQGVVATDNVSSEDARSVFYNENDTIKTVLYGASLLEVQGTGTDGPGGRRQWVFDATADVIGDLYLRIVVEVPTISTSLSQGGTGIGEFLSQFAVSQPMGALNLIDRIDFQVGTQIYQTMYRNDIIHIMTTEQSTGSMNKLFKNLSGVNSYPTAGDAHKTGVSSSGTTFVMQLEPDIGAHTEAVIGRYLIRSIAEDKVVSDCVIPLSMFTRNFNPQKQNKSNIDESGYYLFAAPDQQVQVTVHFSDGKYNPTSTSVGGGLASNSMFGATGGTISPPVVYFGDNPINTDTDSWSTQIFYRQITLANSEREAFVANKSGIPKTIKTTEGIPNPFVFQNSVNRYVLDLSTFNLLGSHLIFSYIQYYSPESAGAALDFDGVGAFKLNSNNINFTTELLLNNTSVFGQIPSSVLSNSEEYLGLENFQPPVTPGGGALGKVFGVTQNGMLKDVNTYSYIRKRFIIPLASTAYGGSMIPLNRFDNIRLVLNFTGIQSKLVTGEFVLNPTVIKDSPAITCAGSTTILYKDGAASLAIY